MQRKMQVVVARMVVVTMLAVAGNAGPSLHAQDMRQQFTAYTQQTIQEKLYAHTDKSFYAAGEICWFRLYNVDGFFNKPLGISKVAYVELLDKNKKPVLQAKLALKDGAGNGSLQLPVSLVSGKYSLRAYTRWMKNFSPDYFFEKIITVVNTHKVYMGDTARVKPKYDIRFFPEGGNLVNGLESRVAFRVADASGKGIACRGYIVNERSDSLLGYQTLKFGMGSFLFTPSASHNYKAIVVLPDSSRVEQVLPAAFSSGYVMQLASTPAGTLKIDVRADASTSAAVVWLFAHTRGMVKLVQSNNLLNGQASFSVDTAALGEGISHFTVFNANRTPVCERLFFKKPRQRLQIVATTDKNVYETRKKVNLSIDAADQNNQSVTADMSMAVYRIDSLNNGTDESDITSYLWLSSDLTGAIESPAYYFNDDSQEAATALDNLLLTQGWRRFRWEDVLQNKKPAFEFTPEFKGHIIKGKVVNNNNGQPAKDVESYLSVVSTRSQVRSAYSDDSGYVKFDMNNFYGNNEIIVQTGGQGNANRHVEMANPFSDKFSNKPLPAFSLQENNAAPLFAEHVSVQVQNAYNSSRLNQQMLPAATDTSAFYSRPDKVYRLDDYVRFTTIEEILREYIPEVNVRKRDGKFYLPVYDNIRRDFFVTDPLILLDGVPVLDPDKIMSYDPLKIRKLEVLARMYYYGNMFFGGIINFITYNGDLPAFELDPHATVIDYETLQLQREFYSPIYETPAAVAGRLPDFRNVLYWSPAIKTNKGSKQEIGFYTSDMSGKFAAVLQGITADGKTGSKTIFFEVKENESVAGKK